MVQSDPAELGHIVNLHAKIFIMGGVATMLAHIVSHILAIGHHALHEVFNVAAHDGSYLKFGQGGQMFIVTCLGKKLVGETGFEPAASTSQTWRSTKLSYSPKILWILMRAFRTC